MKIAYISNFLGPIFIEQFCKGKSYSISATFKSTAIARALLKLGHEVTIFSPGITICNKIISPFMENINFPEGNLEVVYPTIVSFRKFSIINSFLLRNRIVKEKKNSSYDILLYYNITWDAALCLSLFQREIKVLEYEDNIFNKEKAKGSGLHS